MTEIMRCRHCGDVIGAYEPLVALRDGQPQVGSRLTLEDRQWGEAACYHRRCFIERHGESALGE